ncbi:hypothetical protein L1049_013739 [Liquidambar formosana]|uniref:Uncharacterized protein n=1 Tax=Liquidambar formosana TaxID=63359 RepID=A0AAP0RPA5_LIQFO
MGSLTRIPWLSRHRLLISSIQRHSSPSTKNSCTESSCSPLPLAAQVASTRAHESKASTTQSSGSRVGAGGIAGIVLGSVFAVLLAMGVYRVVITRRANTSRANSVQPDA